MVTQGQASYDARRYSHEMKNLWNSVIDQSVNGTFLFRREFMDYHADRFEDFSYLIWKGAELIAVFVAGRAFNSSLPTTLVAHPGLTYGGLVYSAELKYPVLEEVYDVLFKSLREEGFNKLIIKPVAKVFCKFPTEANLFYFYQRGFELYKRELNSVINLTHPFKISKGRKDNIRKARLAGLVVSESSDFSEFWPLLIDNLMHTHGVQPPHSEAEISLLRERLPENIKLYLAKQNENLVGGVLLFLDAKHDFVHTQYISANEQGKSVGAVDAIISHILTEVQTKYARLSFGISTNNGELNAGLLAQKEGFGATVELIDTYELSF